MHRRTFLTQLTRASAGTALASAFLATSTRRAVAALAERPGVAPEVLAADFPSDGPTEFHLQRLRQGESGALIVMNEK